MDRVSEYEDFASKANRFSPGTAATAETSERSNQQANKTSMQVGFGFGRENVQGEIK